MLKIWGYFSLFVVASLILWLVVFVAYNGISVFSWQLFFSDTPPLKAIMGEIVWGGLFTPLKGTIKLLFLTSLVTVPIGLAGGIWLSEFANDRFKKIILPIIEALSAIPSIVVGLFGFVVILFLKKLIFTANTGMITAVFCLSVLVLPTLVLNTFNALLAVPKELKITAISLGLPKSAAIFAVYFPTVLDKIINGILLSMGRIVEDTAVILMTGAVATSVSGGIFDKFEALPFFIYYMSANYTTDTQLAQVFVATFTLLVISFLLLGLASLVRKR